jgi:hypothetical protein
MGENRTDINRDGTEEVLTESIRGRHVCGGDDSVDVVDRTRGLLTWGSCGELGKGPQGLGGYGIT